MFASLSYYSPAMRQIARKDFNSLIEESVKNTAANSMKVETYQNYCFLVLVNDEVKLESTEFTIHRLKGISNKNYTLHLEKFLSDKINQTASYFNNTIISLADRVKIIWLGYAIDKEEETLDISCYSTSSAAISITAHRHTHEHITLLPSKEDPSATKNYIKILLTQNGIPDDRQDFARYVIKALYPNVPEEQNSTEIAACNNAVALALGSEQIVAIANAVCNTFQQRSTPWFYWLRNKFS